MSGSSPVISRSIQIRLLFSGIRGGGFGILVSALLLGFAGGDARAFDAGSVHQEHCTACHARITGGDGRLLYRGGRGIVADAQQLLARVDHCRKGAGLDWGPEHLLAMRDWLNQKYYDFDLEK